MAILEVNNLKKEYTSRFGSSRVQALSNVNFSVEAGEYIAIMGQSDFRIYLFLPGRTPGNSRNVSAVYGRQHRSVEAAQKK